MYFTIPKLKKKISQLFKVLMTIPTAAWQSKPNNITANKSKSYKKNPENTLRTPADIVYILCVDRWSEVSSVTLINTWIKSLSARCQGNMRTWEMQDIHQCKEWLAFHRVKMEDAPLPSVKGHRGHVVHHRKRIMKDILSTKKNPEQNSYQIWHRQPFCKLSTL